MYSVHTPKPRKNMKEHWHKIQYIIFDKHMQRFLKDAMSQTNKPTACRDFPQAMTRGARSLAGDDVAVHHGFRILQGVQPGQVVA